MSNIDAGRIRKDIADLESKKENLMLSLQQDYEDINDHITGEYCKIGEEAYALYKNGEHSLEGLSEYFMNVAQLEKELAAKDRKITEISERYDEEIGILKKLVQSAKKSDPKSNKRFCENCGTAFTPGRDLFCLECGSKLE